jgi:hypothetical protein
MLSAVAVGTARKRSAQNCAGAIAQPYETGAGIARLQRSRSVVQDIPDYWDWNLHSLPWHGAAEMLRSCQMQSCSPGTSRHALAAAVHRNGSTTA